MLVYALSSTAKIGRTKSEIEGGPNMEVAKIAEYARSLYDAHGDRAELEAAQKAKQCQESGNEAEAETWQAVRRAISEIKGARQG